MCFLSFKGRNLFHPKHMLLNGPVHEISNNLVCATS